VERAAGEPFLEFMRREVFAPVGMRQTVPDDVFMIVPSRARFYVRDSAGRLRNEKYVDQSNKWASGGFLSTPSDLVRFGFAMLDARLLKPETIKLLWKPLQLESGEAKGYGLGWFTAKFGGRTVVASPGSSVGGMTAFVILPEQRMVISVMSNVTRAEVLPLWQALARLFLGDGA
jgi:serine beta-lactamase-like protein LACTB, mitochondrial